MANTAPMLATEMNPNSTNEALSETLNLIQAASSSNIQSIRALKNLGGSSKSSADEENEDWNSVRKVLKVEI